MEIKIQVPFQQLLDMIKSLTPGQRAKIRKELDQETKVLDSDQDDFMKFLLNGPVFSKNDIAVINKNRKSIAAWRTKS